MRLSWLRTRDDIRPYYSGTCETLINRIHEEFIDVNHIFKEEIENALSPVQLIS